MKTSRTKKEKREKPNPLSGNNQGKKSIFQNSSNNALQSRDGAREVEYEKSKEPSRKEPSRKEPNRKEPNTLVSDVEATTGSQDSEAKDDTSEVSPVAETTGPTVNQNTDPGINVVLTGTDAGESVSVQVNNIKKKEVYLNDSPAADPSDSLEFSRVREAIAKIHQPSSQTI